MLGTNDCVVIFLAVLVPSASPSPSTPPVTSISVDAPINTYSSINGTAAILAAANLYNGMDVVPNK
ncbi:hypothetical protein HJC23_007129 [Cyclotella cryptica]|uniref:Uncharacterized protein n=1 Tax=Cyclotella cryptica TaxID=29204 RepID=A0ABD3NN49_9STRA